MPTLPNNPDVLVSNDVEQQTHQVMKNLMDVLKQSGSSLDMHDWDSDKSLIDESLSLNNNECKIMLVYNIL